MQKGKISKKYTGQMTKQQDILLLNYKTCHDVY
jgi:hypothetical protein